MKHAECENMLSEKSRRSHSLKIETSLVVTRDWQEQKWRVIQLVSGMAVFHGVENSMTSNSVTITNTTVLDILSVRRQNFYPDVTAV